MIQMLSKFVKSLDVNKLGFSSYANESDIEASFLNLHLSISNGFV